MTKLLSILILIGPLYKIIKTELMRYDLKKATKPAHAGDGGSRAK